MRGITLLVLFALCCLSSSIQAKHLSKKGLLNKLQKDVVELKNLVKDMDSTNKGTNNGPRHIPDETDIDAAAGLGNEIAEDAKATRKLVVAVHIPDETDIDQKAGKFHEIDETQEKPITEDEINENLGYEGDEMIISPDQRKRGVGNNIRLWKDENTGIIHIPYEIDSNIAASDHPKILRHIGEMNAAIECNQNTWKPRTDQDQHYVRFRTGSGCSSYLGIARFSDPTDSTKTYQPITLHPNCIRFNQGTVLHEMLHCMGFSHEQSRSDRDQFIEIKLENINPQAVRNFNKLSSMVQASENTPYDFDSVMHYYGRAFSTNGQDTIVARPEYAGTSFGQRNGMSETDVKEMNAVYQCQNVPVTTTRRPVTTTRRPVTTTRRPVTTTRRPVTTTRRPTTTTRRPTTSTSQPATTTLFACLDNCPQSVQMVSTRMVKGAGEYTTEEDFNRYGRLRVKIRAPVIEKICQDDGDVCVRITFSRSSSSAPKLVVKSPNFVGQRRFQAPKLTGTRTYSFNTKMQCSSGIQMYKINLFGFRSQQVTAGTMSIKAVRMDRGSC